MAVDNMAEIFPSLEILNRLFVGFRPTGNKSSFEPQNEELLIVVRFRDRLGVV
jgi:hypothetical protein